MTNLDELRRALKAPPTTDPGRLHVGEIMARGRRMRRWRRVLVTGVCACLAAAVAVAGATVSQLGPGPRPSPGQPLGGGSLPRPRTAYGAVIDTGIRNASGELVIYGIHEHVRQLPRITFAFMAGYRNAAGHVSADVIVNEFTGSDVSPGFHEPTAPNDVGGQAIPEFGYYAGPAVKITGTLDGRRIRADQALWSVNHKIVVFWFTLAGNPSGQDITGLAAFNARGKRLPSGHNGIGHG